MPLLRPLWLLLIPRPAPGKEALVVQSSLFTLERQSKIISISLPNLPPGLRAPFAIIPLSNRR